MKINVEGRKGRGRQKKGWLHTVENDMRAADGPCEGDMEN